MSSYAPPKSMGKLRQSEKSKMAAGKYKIVYLLNKVTYKHGISVRSDEFDDQESIPEVSFSLGGHLHCIIQDGRH